ncbi:MAG: hypothetical protein AAFX54_03865 [Pseudomonadota bacterium]
MSIYDKIESRDGESNEDRMQNVPSPRRGHQTKTAEEIRQGHTGDNVRYILAFSIIGALGAMIAVAIIF